VTEGPRGRRIAALMIRSHQAALPEGADRSIRRVKRITQQRSSGHENARRLHPGPGLRSGHLV
jgi:hypothetical protein